MFGLIQIHHWCGNDPVRVQLAKVDLRQFVMYLTHLERAHSLKRARFIEHSDWSEAEQFIFGPHGWRIEWFDDFNLWQRSGRSWLWSLNNDPKMRRSSASMRALANNSFQRTRGKDSRS